MEVENKNLNVMHDSVRGSRRSYVYIEICMQGRILSLMQASYISMWKVFKLIWLDDENVAILHGCTEWDVVKNFEAFSWLFNK